MKLILRDHLRRWWWVWLVGIIGNGLLVWGYCISGNHDQNRHFFPLGVFMGAFLLGIDLQRGHARAVLAMPLTAKQIARVWWWAAVGIPAVALVIVTLLVFAIVSAFYGNWSAFADCVIFCGANFLILGFMFFVLTGMPAQPKGGNWVDQIRGAIFGALWGGSVGGSMLFWQLKLDSTTGAVILSIAAIFTIIGWFRAETLVRERAEFRLGLQVPSRKSAKLSRCAEGRGGLLFLVRSTFSRMLLFGLVMAGGFILIFGLIYGAMVAPKLAAISAQTHGAVQAPFMGGNFPLLTFQFLWVAAFQIIPVCMHLRFLRTLPVSAAMLAAVLVFTPLVAMLVILYSTGLLMAVVFHQPLNLGVDLLRQSGFLQAALTAFFVPLLVWRGWGVFTYLIFFAILMGSMIGSIFAKAQFASATGGLVSLLLIGGAFLATKFVLERSSQAFRPRAGQIGGWNWGVSR